MLSLFRRFLNTWPAKVFFGVLCAAFAVWGVGDMIRNIGHDTALAHVAGHRIEPQAFQSAYQRAMNQLSQRMGQTQPTPELRREVAQQTLAKMVAETAIMDQVQRMGIVVPDAALRAAVFAIPAFQGKDGKFDHTVMLNVLRNNGMDEDQLLTMVRNQLAQSQLMDSVRAGARAPDVLVRQVYDFQHETRTATLVSLPVSAAPPPPAPTEAALKRYYLNHPWQFTSPEYRKVKVAVLSPETLAKDIQIPEADVKAYYDQHKSEYVSPAKRSAEVLLATDEKTAQALAATWQSGADWAQMQDLAKHDSATAAAMDDATQTDFPSPELADAVFSAAPDTVTGPVKTALGWYVVRVTKVVPGSSRDFAQVKGEIREKLALQKASDLVYERANKVEDNLASGDTLDQLPATLGLVGVTGTLDAQGETPEGKPAPIPGPPALQQAVIAAAFRAQPGDQPQLTEVPAKGGGTSSYYALVVENVTPPTRKPYDLVAAQVKADWTAAQQRHEQNVVAARLMTAVNAGKNLAAVAKAEGLTVTETKPFTRDNPVQGVPPGLMSPIFALGKAGQATMAATGDGFTVAELTKITDPSPKSDPVGYNALRQAMSRALGDDVEVAYAAALQARDNPRVNTQMLDQMIQ